MAPAALDLSGVTSRSSNGIVLVVFTPGLGLGLGPALLPAQATHLAQMRAHRVGGLGMKYQWPNRLSEEVSPGWVDPWWWFTG